MATDPVLVERATMELIEREVRKVMGQVQNRVLAEVFDAPQPKSEQWVPFINDSTAAVPPNAIMAVSTGSTRDPELAIDYLHCTQASTVFVRLYAVNSATSVEAGAGGLCCLHGPCDILYDSTGGVPVFGDELGPKPGKWGVVKGMAATCEVLGSIDSTGSVFHGTLAPIRAINCVADASIAAATTAYVPGSGTVSVYYYNGSAYTDTGQNTTAHNLSLTAVSTGKILQAKRVSGQWQIDFEACS